MEAVRNCSRKSKAAEALSATRIKAAPALLMMQHLARRQLANINDGAALQSFSSLLGCMGFSFNWGWCAGGAQ
jgi:hypothetical protein